MNTPKQHGFSALIIVLLIALVGVIGFVGWRMYDANQQLAQQQAAQNNPQTTQPQTDPNEEYVVIKEWGVRFKPVEGLSGVQYFKPKNVTSDAVSITTEELGNLEPGCSTKSASMVLGLLTRSTDPQPVSGGVIAKIGDYSYQYRVSGAACSETATSMPVENKAGSLIIESIKTLEAAK